MPECLLSGHLGGRKNRSRDTHCDEESYRSAALGMTSFILRERVRGDSLFSLMATRALSVLAKP